MTDEILKQKNEIIQEMSSDMGVPAEQLLKTLYEREAARQAKEQVKKGLKEDTGEDEVATVVVEDNQATTKAQT